MSNMKSLKEFLSNDVQSNEIYTTDQRKRYRREKKGLYSRQKDCFDFIHLVQNWPELVGPMMAQNTVPLKIKADNLIVLTKHSIFSQELGFMTPVIIKKIQEMFPSFKNEFTKIKFITSERYFNLPEKKTVINEKLDKKFHPFSPEYRKKKLMADKMFEQIEDEETKNLLISLYLQK